MIAAVARSTGDMVAQQIPGDYTNVPLISGGNNCPSSMRLAQVELQGNARTPMFVVPHGFITVPNVPTGQLRCSETTVEFNTITTNISATILRRASDLPKDENVELMKLLELAGERYFLGYEFGRRLCNGYDIPASTVSIWAAPSQPIAARHGVNYITLRPGFKYIYYFSDPPCFYRGDARRRGNVRNVPSPAPRQSPLPPTLGTGDPPLTGSGTARPSTNPIPSATSSDDTTEQAGGRSRRDCFPAAAMVTLRRAGVSRSAPVSDVRAGDEVVADTDGGYSRVLALTHDDESYVGAFVQLHAHNRTLTLSDGHYVPTLRGSIPASKVRVGDVLLGSDGAVLQVDDVDTVIAHGLYAPVTASGTIAIDGMIASTYTSAVPPAAAHALLLPARFAPLKIRAPLASLTAAACGVGRRMLSSS